MRARVQDLASLREANRVELGTCTATQPASLHAAPAAWPTHMSVMPGGDSGLQPPTPPLTRELVAAEIALRSFTCVQLDAAASTAVESALAAGLIRVRPAA